VGGALVLATRRGQVGESGESVGDPDAVLDASPPLQSLGVPIPRLGKVGLKLDCSAD
jgi:hypothetical protein